MNKIVHRNKFDKNDEIIEQIEANIARIVMAQDRPKLFPKMIVKELPTVTDKN